MEEYKIIDNLKESCNKDSNIKLFNSNITNKLMNNTPSLSSFLVHDSSLLIDENKSDFILKLASLSNKERKYYIKNKLILPDDINVNIKENLYIRTHHLGQNGGIFSDICATITCSDIPHTTMYHNGKIRIRRLSINECEELMGWPKDWTKYGIDSQGQTYEIPSSARYKMCGNGIVSPVSKHIVESFLKNSKILSLCSGVDGSCLLLNDNHKKMYFVEKDKHPSANLRYNYNNTQNFGDLTKLESNNVKDVDLIFASLPCQSFSQAGNRGGLEDVRGTLFFYMAKILKENETPYFIFENVKGILTHDKGNTIKIIMSVFCSLGYEIDFNLFNSKHFGIPQTRERFFMVGRKI